MDLRLTHLVSITMFTTQSQAIADADESISGEADHSEVQVDQQPDNKEEEEEEDNTLQGFTDVSGEVFMLV